VKRPAGCFELGCKASHGVQRSKVQFPCKHLATYSSITYFLGGFLCLSNDRTGSKLANQLLESESRIGTRSRFRQASITVAFQEAKILALSFPTPLLAPVMIATCIPSISYFPEFARNANRSH
jgi:hypothetical protein